MHALFPFPAAARTHFLFPRSCLIYPISPCLYAVHTLEFKRLLSDSSTAFEVLNRAQITVVPSRCLWNDRRGSDEFCITQAVDHY